MSNTPLDLTFLGSGNAFGAQGRAFSSFLLNQRYLFDCGPTVLQQMRKASLSSDDIDTVFISHFHADHFFGLPFLFLDAWRNRRTAEMTIVGPPGIEERTRRMLDVGYEKLLGRIDFPLRFIDVEDGFESAANGVEFSAAMVSHVEELECFAYKIELDGRSLVYSGDTTLCDGLLGLVPETDVVVLECSCGEEPVHLSPAAVDEVRRHAAPDTPFIVTHLDGLDHPDGFRGLIVASDLARYRF